MKSRKIFALVDCNSFFCSCERLFRPDLRSIPVGVLSNNDGCFVSRTPELKKLGVPMGAPFFKYKELCKKNNVQVFSANFSLYSNISKRVVSTLHSLEPVLEVYSIDEAFLDLSKTKDSQLQSYGKHIKARVLRNTGIPVSVGIGPTKVLSKLANLLAKKYLKTGGVVTLTEEQRTERALSLCPVGSIWGIGRKSAQKLEDLKIKTALDFRNYHNQALIQKKFSKVGVQIQKELRGISCFELNQELPKKKGILSSRSFGAPVYRLEDLKEAVARYASIAAEKLRKQDSVCSEIRVSIRSNFYKNVEQYHSSQSLRLNCHTSDTCKIISSAFQILDRIYRPGIEYKKASIQLSRIIDKEQAQLSFFEPFDSFKTEVLMNTLDRYNEREGAFSLRSAACGTDQNPRISMNQSNKSPRYLTGWSQLRRVS